MPTKTTKKKTTTTRNEILSMSVSTADIDAIRDLGEKLKMPSRSALVRRALRELAERNGHAAIAAVLEPREWQANRG